MLAISRTTKKIYENLSLRFKNDSSIFYNFTNYTSRYFKLCVLTFSFWIRDTYKNIFQQRNIKKPFVLNEFLNSRFFNIKIIEIILNKRAKSFFKGVRLNTFMRIIYLFPPVNVVFVYFHLWRLF